MLVTTLLSLVADRIGNLLLKLGLLLKLETVHLNHGCMTLRFESLCWGQGLDAGVQAWLDWAAEAAGGERTWLAGMMGIKDMPRVRRPARDDESVITGG